MDEPLAAEDQIDPFRFEKRETKAVTLAPGLVASSNQPPRVIIKSHLPEDTGAGELAEDLRLAQKELKDNKIEGLLLSPKPEHFRVGLAAIANLPEACPDTPTVFLIEVSASILPNDLPELEGLRNPRVGWVVDFSSVDSERLKQWISFCALHKQMLAVDTSASALEGGLATVIAASRSQRLILTQSRPEKGVHPIGSFRLLAEASRRHGIGAPLWLRNTSAQAIAPEDDYFSARLLESSVYSGALLCDGLGDLISVETEPDLARAANLAYGVLQGAKARISKTEFVACPSCGRTLFNLQSTTQAIRAETGHLKNVTIAVMGCIVNGPGEMADADFGYVGGAPGKVNLYVGKTPVKYNVPETEAVERLKDLIKEHGKWSDPPPADAEEPDRALAGA
jgi:(E)-4-hydroxy-3-methylbut-2-enyl-diphosphate synthase